MMNPTPCQPIEHVLGTINAATTHLRLYADDHPLVAQSFKTAYRGLTQLLGSQGDTTLLLIVRMKKSVTTAQAIRASPVATEPTSSAK